MKGRNSIPQPVEANKSAMADSGSTVHQSTDKASGHRRQWWKYALAAFCLTVGGVASDAGLRHWSWNELLTRTAQIDSLQLWQPYMETTFCGFTNAASSDDPEDLYVWTFDAYREVVTLSSRIESRVARLESMFIAPWHTDLQVARSAALDHYEVWQDSFSSEEQYLFGASLDDDIFNDYLGVAFEYEGAISATFETSRDAYYLAAPYWADDPQSIEAAFLDAGEIPLSCDSGGNEIAAFSNAGAGGA